MDIWKYAKEYRDGSGYICVSFSFTEEDFGEPIGSGVFDDQGRELVKQEYTDADEELKKKVREMIKQAQG